MSNIFSQEDIENWRKWAQNNKKTIPTPQNNINQSGWEAINSYRTNQKSSCNSCNRRRYL
jgi:hypothetical protein